MRRVPARQESVRKPRRQKQSRKHRGEEMLQASESQAMTPLENLMAKPRLAREFFWAVYPYARVRYHLRRLLAFKEWWETAYGALVIKDNHPTLIDEIRVAERKCREVSVPEEALWLKASRALPNEERKLLESAAELHVLANEGDAFLERIIPRPICLLFEEKR